MFTCQFKQSAPPSPPADEEDEETADEEDEETADEEDEETVADDECGGCAGPDNCCGAAYKEPWSNVCETTGVGCPTPEEGEFMCFNDWNPERHAAF